VGCPTCTVSMGIRCIAPSCDACVCRRQPHLPVQRVPDDSCFGPWPGAFVLSNTVRVLPRRDAAPQRSSDASMWQHRLASPVPAPAVRTAGRCGALGASPWSRTPSRSSSRAIRRLALEMESRPLLLVCTTAAIYARLTPVCDGCAALHLIVGPSCACEFTTGCDRKSKLVSARRGHARGTHRERGRPYSLPLSPPAHHPSHHPNSSVEVLRRHGASSLANAGPGGLRCGGVVDGIICVGDTRQQVHPHGECPRWRTGTGTDRVRTALTDPGADPGRSKIGSLSDFRVVAELTLPQPGWKPKP
jgi:hypothetical protein